LVLGDPLSALPVCPIPRRADVSLELLRQPPRRAKKSHSIPGTCSHTSTRLPLPDISIPTAPLRSPLLAASLTLSEPASGSSQQAPHTRSRCASQPSLWQPSQQHASASREGVSTSELPAVEVSSDCQTVCTPDPTEPCQTVATALPQVAELHGAAKAALVRDARTQSIETAPPDTGRLSGRSFSDDGSASASMAWDVPHFAEGVGNQDSASSKTSEAQEQRELVGMHGSANNDGHGEPEKEGSLWPQCADSAAATHGWDGQEERMERIASIDTRTELSVTAKAFDTYSPSPLANPHTASADRRQISASQGQSSSSGGVSRGLLGSPLPKCEVSSTLPPDTFSVAHQTDGVACMCTPRSAQQPVSDSAILSVLLSSFRPPRVSKRPSTAPPVRLSTANPGCVSTGPLAVPLATLSTACPARPPSLAVALQCGTPSRSLAMAPVATLPDAAPAEPSTAPFNQQANPDNESTALARARAQTVGHPSGMTHTSSVDDRGQAWAVHQALFDQASSCKQASLKRSVTASTEAGAFLAREAAEKSETCRAARNDFHVRGWSRAAAYNNTVGADQFCKLEHLICG
jgi:hypothetical protein